MHDTLAIGVKRKTSGALREALGLFDISPTTKQVFAKCGAALLSAETS